MTKAFTVESSLRFQTNFPEFLRNITRGFETIDRLVKSTQGNISRLESDLRGLSSSSRGIGALVRQFEKLKMPEGLGADLRELRNATAGLADMAKETAGAFREMAEASRGIRLPGGSGGGPGGSRPGGGRAHGWSWHGINQQIGDAGFALQLGGDAGMGLLERAFTAYGDVQLGTVMAQSDKRVTDAVMGQANALIRKLQGRYPALTQSEGITLFRNSMGIFGDAGEALGALPGAVRLQQLYQLAPLGRGGSGGSEVQAAEKAGDALQAFIDPRTGKIDTRLYDRFIDFQARSYQAGGGLVDAKGWLAFARTARSAGIGLSPRAMEETQALLEMSPGRTGTALMSAFQVFGATTAHMTDKNRAGWQGAGLLGGDGDIIDRALYQADPFQWVWKTLVPKLAEHGVKSRDQILQWLTTFGQRGTVSGLLADIAIGQTPITRTADKMERQDPNLVDKLQQSNLGKMAAFEAAQTNLLVALGKFSQGPALDFLTKLTDGFNKIADLAEKHTRAAEWALGVGAGLSVISKATGTLANVVFLGSPLVTGIGALAKGAAKFAPGTAEALGLAGIGPGLVTVAGAVTSAWSLIKGAIKDPSDPYGIMPGHPKGGGLGELWRWLSSGSGGGSSPAIPSPGSPLGAHFQRQAYVTGGDGGSPVTVPVILQIDGKTIGRAAARTFLRNGVQSGMTAHDGSMSPYPAGMPSGVLA